MTVLQTRQLIKILSVKSRKNVIHDKHWFGCFYLTSKHINRRNQPSLDWMRLEYARQDCHSHYLNKCDDWSSWEEQNTKKNNRIEFFGVFDRLFIILRSEPWVMQKKYKGEIRWLWFLNILQNGWNTRKKRKN